MLAIIAGGCEKGPQSTPVAGIKLDKYQLTITEGDKATLTATVLPDNATNKNVSWTSSNEKVATVSNTGEVTAVAPGKATITVTAEDGAKTAKCEVTIEKRIYQVETITLDKTSLEIVEGDKATLTATVKPDNATYKGIIWSSSDEKVATIKDGEITAIAPGTATITAKAEKDDRSALCVVTVSKRVYPVESVSLDKTSLELTEGDKATLTATVLPDNATNKNVSWSSSDEKVATVSTTGEVTAVAPGKAAITVTTEDGAKTAKCEVTVNKRIYPVESVSLDKTSLELTEGDKATLTATVLPENASNKDVSWTSSDATIATVSKDGEVSGIKPGSTTVTVTTMDGRKTAKCQVTIEKRIYPVESVSIDKTSLELTEGDKATLTATVLPDNATNKNVSWSSSDEKVATVSASGEVTAVAPGKAAITVTTEDGAKTAKCEVTVNKKIYPVESVSIDKTSLELTEGDKTTLTATVLPENASNKNVSWSSSDEKVATVSATGEVTAVAPGKATITVTTEDGAKTAKCEVTVNKKIYPVESVSLDKTSLELTEGDKATLTATVLPDNATNKNVSWSSSDEKVATVSASGEVTAVAPGKAAITVTTEDGAKTAKCEVTVNKKIYPVESVSIDKTSLELTEGDKTTLTATVLPENASNKNVSWSSSDEKVATVSANGEVTAVAPGKAAITVTTEDGAKTAKCQVTIEKRIYPVESVSIDKTSLELTEGDKATLTATVLPDNATNKNVSWSSSDEKVATVSTTGEVTAVAPGKAAITVTTEDGAKTAKCEVTVKAKTIHVESITLNKAELRLEPLDRYTLIATVKPDNATNKEVKWTTSDNSIVSFFSGDIMAKKAGTATITATTVDGGFTATCKVTVKDWGTVDVTGISLNKSTTTLFIGSKETLTATIKPSNATDKTVTWDSSDPAVASVNNGEVTALKAGKAIITATAKDGGYTATCEVNVSDQSPEIKIDKDNYTVAYTGETINLNITANVNYSITTKDNWIKVKGDSLTISSNNSTKERTGAATISNSEYGISLTVTVKQEASPNGFDNGNPIVTPQSNK